METKQSGFDLFWNSYPRKTSKGAARRAWAKRKFSVEQVLEVVQAVNIQVLHGMIKRNDKFKMHPATWLNAECWEDEIETAEVAEPEETNQPRLARLAEEYNAQH